MTRSIRQDKYRAEYRGRTLLYSETAKTSTQAKEPQMSQRGEDGW